MEASSRVTLSIGDLAHRTGVPISTLRSWEKRYGFLQPDRRAGEHRRYSQREPTPVAAPVRSGSVFAELRRRHPVLRPEVLSRRILVSMSHAIEDECCARAADPVLFGSFERESGTHDDLIAADWSYAALWRVQTGEEDPVLT